MARFACIPLAHTFLHVQICTLTHVAHGCSDRNERSPGFQGRSVCVCIMCMQWPWRLEQDIGFFGVGVQAVVQAIDEPHSVGAGN